MKDSAVPDIDFGRFDQPLLEVDLNRPEDADHERLFEDVEIFPVSRRREEINRAGGVLTRVSDPRRASSDGWCRR